MDRYAFKKDMDGYTDLEREAEICRKYGIDYRIEKGAVARIMERFHPAKIELDLSEIIQETASSKTLRLVSRDGYLPPFQAGQYLSLAVEIDGVRTSRPYSISSAPHQTGFYDITIRRKDEGFVSSYLLDRTRVGDRFEARSPEGHFHYNPLFHGNDLVFLAGGSGITPFMSMIREVTDRGLDRKIHLIYGSDLQSDVIFHRELKARAKNHENFRYSLVISSPTKGYRGLKGFITSRLIGRLVGDVKGKMFYICGPEQMYRFCLPELEKLGLPRRKIRREVYGPPDDVTKDAGWPAQVGAARSFDVRIRGRRTIKAVASEPLLVAFERHGIAVPSSCRSGECSLCRVKLLAGRVFQPQGVILRKSDARFGYIHSCMAYPLEDLEILL
ncbi:MAG: 2Fe-2S iron-sulfur cluster binding domain-containing protein [Deltaproteobacteria bacterium]|nr:2Fe-2S iron-sulfur cluster binding domain-containing protein [Deltaproteobacteria bacterium]